MEIDFLARKFYDYQRHMLGRSHGTLRGYRNAINGCVTFLNIKKLEEITENNLKEMFMNGRTVREWKVVTFIDRYRNLNVFFEWCISNRYLDMNPLAEIQLPKREKKLPPKLSKDEALKLLEVVYNYPYEYKYLRYRNHAIFATFMFAGLRKSELLHLRLADVDVANLTIFVSQGKGNKDRIVPMSYTLAEILTKYLEERKRLNKTCASFFASLNRNTGFTDTGIRRLANKMRDVSRIDFTIHKLRHTFATLMLEGGCNIFALSKMMGHSDLKTTTIYLAASAEHLRSQMVMHPLNNAINVR